MQEPDYVVRLWAVVALNSSFKVIKNKSIFILFIKFSISLYHLIRTHYVII